MIELCNRKRMLIAIVVFGCLSVLVIILESQLTSGNSHHLHQMTASNGNNTASCWTREHFTILDNCHVCSDFESKSSEFSVCYKTGYKEKVNCEKEGEVFRSCERVVWIEERKFWTFEGCMLVAGVLSGLIVVYRQRQIDQRMIQRIQKQIAAGV